jgi:hypothetical protein
VARRSFLLDVIIILPLELLLISLTLEPFTSALLARRLRSTPCRIGTYPPLITLEALCLASNAPISTLFLFWFSIRSLPNCVRRWVNGKFRFGRGADTQVERQSLKHVGGHFACVRPRDASPSVGWLDKAWSSPRQRHESHSAEEDISGPRCICYPSQRGCA